MRSNVNVRLKPKVKLKIGLFVCLTAVCLWLLVTSELFDKKDTVTHANFRAVAAESCRYYGKHPIYKCTFTIKSDTYFTTELSAEPGLDGKYCIGQIDNNGEFVGYVMAHYEKCE